ncbi:MAG: Co2+/Mg2+ efflux protein ApaG [Gammaproteobacteria bacterium]|nr:Co2+/Mg2+ efflux protein ApaG [Gammaproteobacteria bacterium]
MTSNSTDNDNRSLTTLADGEHAIEVLVETSYLAVQSEPADKQYVFSYTITIENQGRLNAQLVSRRWEITDANGKVQEVEGPGVVGEQPLIKPGEAFRYSSGAMLETPVGSMQGHYCMRADDGSEFKAIIQPFTLACPGVLN